MNKQILAPKKRAADRGLGDMRFPQRGADRFFNSNKPFDCEVWKKTGNS